MPSIARVAVLNFSSKMATRPHSQAYSFRGVNPHASHRERDEHTAQGPSASHRLHHPNGSVWRSGVRRSQGRRRWWRWRWRWRHQRRADFVPRLRRPAALLHRSRGGRCCGTSTPRLLTYKHAKGKEGTQVVPALAEKMPDISPDGKTYKLKLRPNMKYSDGTPIKASDFAYGIQRLFKADSGRLGVLRRHRRRQGLRGRQGTHDQRHQDRRQHR